MAEFLKWMHDGGPVMWPILGLSVLGLAIVLDRFWTLSRFLSAGGQTPSPGGQTPVEGGQTPGEGGQTPGEGGQTPGEGGQTPGEGGQTPDAGGLSPQEQLNRLQRGFGVVSTIITAEPMLGILGTVTGIIKTFSAFRVDDAASPLAATAGIGEALITTAAGLVAALVLLFPYNLLLGMLAKAAAKIEHDSAVVDSAK